MDPFQDTAQTLSQDDSQLSLEEFELLRYLSEEPGAAVDENLRAAAQAEWDCSAPQELSHAQIRFWLLEQSHPGDPFHNVAVCVDIRGELDADLMEECLGQLIRRHEALRTYFVVQDGRPVQVVEPEVDFVLRRMEVAAGTDADALIGEIARRPIELDRAPVMRAVLLMLGDGQYKLICVIHHIASDAWSMGLLWKELDAFYTARKQGGKGALPALPLRYADYARREHSPEQEEIYRQQLARWEEWLAGAPSGATLPPDRDAGGRKLRTAHTVEMHLDRPRLERVSALCRQESATLYMVLTAALSILLSRYTGAEDVVIGSPIANRRQPDVEHLVGAFTNMLAMRTRLAGDPTVSEVLKQVRAYALNAYGNQELPFQRLVEKLRTARKGIESPLYRVVLALQNAPMRVQALGGLESVQSDIATGIASVDLILEGEESAEGLRLRATYDADQYDRSSIEVLLGQFSDLLIEMAQHAEARISALRFGEPSFDETAEVATKSANLLDAFRHRASQLPGAVALTANRTVWSYGELARRSEALASALTALPAGSGIHVGIAARKAPLRIMSVLAAWIAGLEPVFLDSALPHTALVRDAVARGVDVLLVESADGRLYDEVGLQAAAVETGLSAVRLQSDGTCRPEKAVGAEALGATLTWLQQKFALSEGDIFRGRFVHETAAWEILWPLSQGATIDASRHASLPAAVEHVGALRDAVRTRGLLESRLVLCSGAPPAAQDIEPLADSAAGRVVYLYQPGNSPAILAWRSCAPCEERLDALLGEPCGVPLKLVDAHGRHAAHRVPAVLHYRDGESWRSSGDIVRQGADGVLRLVRSQPALFWSREAQIRLRPLEETLRTDLQVGECALMPVVLASGESKLVCYYVPLGEVSAVNLLVALRLRLPSYCTPDVLVPVSSLPLTAGGEMDREALARLPILDEGDAARLQSELEVRSQGQLKVVIEKRARERRTLEPAATLAAVEQADEPPSAEPDTRPSIAEGEPLIVPIDAPRNLGEVLTQAAEKTPHHGVTYLDSDRESAQTYPKLLAEAERILAGLRAAGLQPRDAVLFQLAQHRDFVPAFWACMIGGFVPVPIGVAAGYREPNATVNKIFSCLQTLDNPVVLCSDQLLPKLNEIEQAVEISNVRLLSIDALRNFSPDRRHHACAGDDLAILLLTSGSSGAPKLVMQTHRAILVRTAANIQRHGFGQDDISLNWLPLDHVGGLVMFHVHSVYMRAEQIQAYSQAVIERPQTWLDWMDRWRVTLTWAPNFAYGLVNAQAEAIRSGSWDLRSVRHILNGGEAIAGATASRFLMLLSMHGLRPDAMYPCWGMSETCSGVLYSNDFCPETPGDKRGVEVGQPIPGFAVRVVDDGCRLVPQGTVGLLQVRGENVTRGYLKNSSANESAFPEPGWFDTGDLAVMREGKITICGRKKEQIIIHGVNHNAAEIEATVEGVPGVEPSWTAAIAVRSEEGERLAVFFHTVRQGVELRALLSVVRRAILQNHQMGAALLLPVAKSDIAKTELGKIQKTELRRRLEGGKFASILSFVEGQDGLREGLPDWHFERIWRRDERRWPALPTIGGATLVFGESGEMFDALCHELKSAGRQVIAVTSAARTALFAETRHAWNPSEAAGAVQLIEALASAGTVICEVVCLSAGIRNAKGDVLANQLLAQIGAPLHLVQALAHVQGEKYGVTLAVVTRGSQAVLPDEQPSTFSATPALLRTIAAELPWVRCREIDLEAQGEDFAGLAEELALPALRMEAAMRGKARYTPALRAVDVIRAAQAVEHPIPSGLWLITGGLGGVGTALALHLAQQKGIRLLLVGRTPVEQIEAQLQAGQDAPNAQNYKRLLDAGVPFLYRSAELSDPAAVSAAISEAEAHFVVEVVGACHLAGIGNLVEHLREANRDNILDLTLDAFRPHFAAKVHGTAGMFAALEERRTIPVFCFSSVMAHFGAVGFAPYSVANALQSEMTRAYRRSGFAHASSLAWSMWDDLGMSANCPEAVRTSSQALGYALISEADGLTSFDAASRSGNAELLIGLDAAQRPIERLIEETPRGIEELTVFHTQPLSGWSATTADQCGVQVSVRNIRIEEMPFTSDGVVDVEALRLLGARSDSTEYEAPETMEEELVSRVWCEVLGRIRVGVGDNFFDLGGHSLLATRAVARLRSESGVEIALRELFEWPTVRSLATRIAQLRAEGAGGGEAEGIRRVSRAGDLELSWSQSRLWFLDQLHPGSAFYNVPLRVRLSGSLEVDRLRGGLERLVERHEVLRTRFESRQGRPVQVIEPTGELSWREAESVDAEQTGVLAESEARGAFDLSRGPLLRVLLIHERSSGEHVLVLNVHHIIADAWSLGVLWEELKRLYRGEELSSQEVQYADYVAWHREWMSGEREARELEYWKRQLSGAPGLLELPTDYARPAVLRYEGEHLGGELSGELSAGLQELSRRHGVTLYMTLLAAFAVVLSRYSGQSDLVVGTPIANRGRREAEGLVGFLLNTLAMRLRVDREASFSGLLREVKRTTLEAYEHQQLPFERLVEELHPERSVSHTPLTQVMFAVLESPLDESGLTGVEIRHEDLATGTSRCDLVLSVEEKRTGLRVRVEYSTELFLRERMERLLGHYVRVLEEAVRDGEQRVWELEILSGEERAQLRSWSGEVESWGGGETLGELFARVAESRGEAIAVVCEGRQWSYGELNRQANRVAHRLQELGVGAETPVGLAMERSPEMVAGLLGIVKAGGAYVPLDPEYPQARLEYLLADTGAQVVVSERGHAARFTGRRVVIADEAGLQGAGESEPKRLGTAENLAYILYTSGSTGTPKGVAVTQYAVMNRLLWMIETHSMDIGDIVLQKTPFTFDVSIWEFFCPLLCGARLVLARPDGHRDNEYLARLIREQSITIAHFVATMLQEFLNEPASAQCTSLRLVVQSGEALPLEVSWRFQRTLRCALGNFYGPTEAAIEVSTWMCSPDDDEVPIGYPIRNLTLQILDEVMNRVPVGVPGDLYIGGVGLARGYRNQPGRTADVFVPDRNSSVPGARMYRTGDRARYREDGAILFLGRADEQVKLRGQRIELGEIESVLAEYPAVAQAAVILQKDAITGPRLVGYLILSAEAHGDTSQAEASFDVRILREHLAARLPGYMVPAAFVVLDTFPLTTSGKLDRKALPAPDAAKSTDRQDLLLPRTEEEKTLAGIWMKVLEISSVDVRDSFFEIGGSSLLVPVLRSAVAERFGRRIDIVDFFRYPSIEEFSKLLVVEAASTGATETEVARDRGARRARARRPDYSTAVSGVHNSEMS